MIYIRICHYISRVLRYIVCHPAKRGPPPTTPPHVTSPAGLLSLPALLFTPQRYNLQAFTISRKLAAFQSTGSSYFHPGDSIIASTLQLSVQTSILTPHFSNKPTPEALSNLHTTTIPSITNPPSTTAIQLQWPLSSASSAPSMPTWSP